MGMVKFDVEGLEKAPRRGRVALSIAPAPACRNPGCPFVAPGEKEDAMPRSRRFSGSTTTPRRPPSSTARSSRTRRSRHVAATARPAPEPPGTVLTVDFELDGQQFTAINGGPEFTFNEAVSLLVTCADQEEVDYYWDKLTEGGEEASAAGSRTTSASPGRSCPTASPS